jgi:hypothetical protein
MSTKRPISFPLLTSFALLIVAVAGCKTATDVERPQMSKIIALGGAAQFSVDDGKTWRPIRLGRQLAPGSLIKVNEGTTNGVMLAIAYKPDNVRYRDPRDPPNSLAIYGNSLLKIEKVTEQSIAGRKVGDFRLTLFEGCVKGDAWMFEPGDYFHPYVGPKLETIEKQPNQNYYEIRGSNVVVHMQHAVYVFYATGRTRILHGSAVLEFTDGGATKDLFPGQLYDSATGNVISIPEHAATATQDVSKPYEGPDWKGIGSPPKTNDRFQVPQRPF